MAQELLTYAGLAQRLNISIGAAKGLAKGLRLTRYTAPDGKTLLLVDLSRLGTAGLAADDIDDDAEDFDFGPRRHREPNPRRAMRAQIVTSLHERIEDIQRQLDRVENGHDDQAPGGPDSPLLAELFRMAADARHTAEQAREELAAYRLRRWWKRTSA